MPASGEQEEWLIVDTASDTTDLTVLDAHTFEAPPLATVRLGHRIPPGFHGNWFPSPRVG
ncbi:carotenoid oxygenase family protein [Methylobacterium sp. Leaf106]|uniref:carotenoid oxygenase family protein n=1 Tax=Methylobacterium sp. Leaf106 TaxID=1736255 RepID=UPI0006FBFF6B|nr:carotenoid oxygenase family protein [Methylobacterium sp. Leaf106]KQP44710.1 hypothetical protein ASF34_21525 [Methylobacterium sp. Leaf106]